MLRFNQERRSWKEIAFDLVGEKDSQRFHQLVGELDQALALHQIVSSWQADLADNNKHLPLRTSVENIVDIAVALMGSEYASLQMLFPERGQGGELRLLAFRGFNPHAAKFWKWVQADSRSTCGIALCTSQRVVAPDIALCDFMADSEDQEVYLQTGIHACQTTPLVGRNGNVVGMISTHWRTPHEPSEQDFKLFDILAGQAAHMIEGG